MSENRVPDEYRIPLGKPAPRPDPATCEHRWATDEDALTGETYWYCEHNCGATESRTYLAPEAFDAFEASLDDEDGELP